MYSSNSGIRGDNEATGRQYRFDSMNIELGESPDAVERASGSSFLARWVYDARWMFDRLFPIFKSFVSNVN